jgi:hypothetical protein
MRWIVGFWGRSDTWLGSRHCTLILHEWRVLNWLISNILLYKLPVLIQRIGMSRVITFFRHTLVEFLWFGVLLVTCPTTQCHIPEDFSSTTVCTHINKVIHCLEWVGFWIQFCDKPTNFIACNIVLF